MDGSIELKSKAGVGTTVIVKIPFKIGTQDKNSNLSDKPVSLDDYSVEGMRALVVEDNGVEHGNFQMYTGRQRYGSYMCSRRARSS